VDFRLPDASGAELIRWAVSNNRAQSVYCITGNANGRAASEVLEAGCKEVLEKPIDPDKLAQLVPFRDMADPPSQPVVDSPAAGSPAAGSPAAGSPVAGSPVAGSPVAGSPVAGSMAAGSPAAGSAAASSMAHAALQAESLYSWRRRFAPDILGEDPRLVEALDTVHSVADTDCTVLITGESGTGKEMIARALHASSPRARGPFIALNCAAIPDTMVEAELFGHVRGAFTGAHATRSGRVVAADGGTLFLDEIGDMPLHAQAKLLRVLQDRTITPVGADMPVSIDIRVVAATNQDLEAMIDEGRFRGDLYYRLGVIPVDLPPLRERRNDIIELARELLEQINARHRRNVTGLDSSAQRALIAHHWPGNVRELAHVIERTILLKKTGVVSASDLRLGCRNRRGASQWAAKTMKGLDLRQAIEHVERELIDEALERTGGNRTEAAALLGLNRTTLVEKIRKHSSS